MEGVISGSDVPNKENIVPGIPLAGFISGEESAISVPVLKKGKCPFPAVRRPLRRLPLQDITHLFVNVQSQQPLLLSYGALSTGFQMRTSDGCCRKRKADTSDDDTTRKDVGKILRTGFG